MKNIKTPHINKHYYLLGLLVLALLLPILANVGRVNAAPFQQAFVRLDRLSATTATGGRVCVKPSVSALAQTEATIQVTFPTTSGTDYVVNSTASNWVMTTTNLDSGQTAMPGVVSGTTTASSVSGKTVTFPISDLSNSSNLYCFNFAATNTLTTSSAAASETTQGTVTTRTSAPATIDQATFSQSIITDDQVVISATVPPSFTFSLNGNTDSFASNLSTGSIVGTNGRQVTITTNAASGWIVWVKNLNNSSSKGALRSATAGNYNITGTSAAGAASHLLTAGTEDYGLATTIPGGACADASGGGTVTLDAAYDGTTAGWAGTLDPLAYRPIASSNGTANGDCIQFQERATIAGQTPAASDYTDTLTVIGAGVF